MKQKKFEDTLLKEWNIELFYGVTKKGKIKLDTDSIREEFEIKLKELENKL